VVQAAFNLIYLDGGAYEYGSSKVAVSYGTLLQGSFTRNGTGGNTPGYGAWDSNPLPAPAAPLFGPALGIGNTIHALDLQNAGTTPYLQQWSLNVQRQLPWNTFLQAAYIGNRAVHLDGQLNPISQPNPSILRYGTTLSANIGSAAAASAGVTAPYANYRADLGNNATVAHTLSPFPQYSNVYNNFDQSGAADYEGFQLNLEKRFSNGLSFLSSYTISKTLTNVDVGLGSFNGLPENKYNQALEFTAGAADILNNAHISGTYELPISPGKSLPNRGVAGCIFGGLQTGFILGYQSGTPFGVSENDNPLSCAGCFNRPNEVAGISRSTTGYKNLSFASSQSNRRVFNTTAFTSSTTGSFVLGNAYRTYSQLRNPSYLNEDVNASKKFTLGEHANFIL